jgi:hypothetical protein
MKNDNLDLLGLTTIILILWGVSLIYAQSNYKDTILEIHKNRKADSLQIANMTKASDLRHDSILMRNIIEMNKKATQRRIRGKKQDIFKGYDKQ